jgi:osmoprotectant transport system ATP-binding protein
MIELDHVTKRFGDGPAAVTAVDDLTLNVGDGEVVALVGSSGSGKTTTLRMINRLIEPTAGTIRIDGEDIRGRSDTELRRGIGYVIQQAGLFPHRTVIDNVVTVPRLLGWDRRTSKTRAKELLELVGLDPTMADRYPAQLSGGQQQRVGVARALAADPPVLLMDEPFGAVDPIVRATLQREFARLQRELGKTVVFVTHDVDEAMLLGDRIAVLETGGRLAQLATAQELLSAPASPFVADFLGGRQLDVVDGVAVGYSIHSAFDPDRAPPVPDVPEPEVVEVDG